MKDGRFEPLENGFRLREGHQVVGYSRTMGARTFYSPDNYAWSGRAIAHTEKDAFVGRRDKNNWPLFANDIVLVRFGPEPKGEINVWIQEREGRFLLVDLESRQPIELEALDQPVSLTHQSHIFLNQNLLFGDTVH